MYRFGEDGGTEVFLGHPGGPYFYNRDDGCWTIPKGQVEVGETILEAAKREFSEETGIITPEGVYIDLGDVRYEGKKNKKTVYCLAFKGNFSGKIKSNFCEVEYPPKSGEKISIPELDIAKFFNIKTARKKILAKQAPFIDRLISAIAPS